MVNLILLALLAQQPLPSVVVPPSNERAIVFVDRGRTYHVGMASGAVTFYETTPLPGPGPEPKPPTPPPVPPSPLTGFPATVREAFLALPISGNIEVAKSLAHACDVTIAQAGGLSYGPQEIVYALASNIETLGITQRLSGFKLGDLIASQGATTREQVIQAVQDVKTAMESIK